MELRVYNGEYFERGTRWYIVFSIIILAVVVISFLSNNILGGVLVLVFVGGYIYYLTKINEVTTMIIGKNALQVGKIPFLRNNLKGFVLEYHIHKEKIHNIVIIDNNTPRIYTIDDTDQNLENFVKELSNYIPMLDKYEQSGLDKFIRKIKL